ncbi:MAG: hypothetical protein HWN65_06390 [Candidatus Helarchaeota archaeon]|nr:hypothetical protein [Candidatus Helarchaeota archaeon]
MNKRKFFVSIFFVFLITNFACFPVLAATTYLDYGLLPITDAENDVIRATSIATPTEGTLVGTHPEIDIKNAFLHPNNEDIILELYGAPILNSNYSITVSFNTDSDDIMEYMIMLLFGDFLLVKLITLTEYQYWNSIQSNWQSSPVNLPFSINGTNITFEGVGIAISDLASVEVGVMTQFEGETPNYIYTDIAPETTRIPGFTIIPLMFSIIALVALSFIIGKRTKDISPASLL